MAGPLPQEGDPLSPREEDVLRCVAHGWTNSEIGMYLAISPHTVKHHISRVLAKLGVRNRTTAAAYAHRTRLVL